MHKRFLLPFLMGALLASSTLLAATTAAVNVAVSIGYAVTFSPAFLTFPTIGVGTASSQTISVTNNGTSTISFGIAFTGGNTADFSQTNDCAGSLAPGTPVTPPPSLPPTPPPPAATCRVTVTFTPSSTAAQSVSLAVSVSGGNTYYAAVGGQGTTSTPTSITLNPSGVTVADNTPTGTVLSTATVRMSDGSTYGGTLTSSNPLFGIDGFNVVLATPLSPSLDGTAQVTTIGAP
jgi:hypothetical protein